MNEPVNPSQVERTVVPCRQWSLEEPHDAHDWDAPVDGPAHCPGYDAPDEYAPEPAPPPTLSQQVRDLERVIERVREAVGIDQPATTADRTPIVGNVAVGLNYVRSEYGGQPLPTAYDDGTRIGPSAEARLAVAEHEATAYRNQVKALVREVQAISEEWDGPPLAVIVLDGHDDPASEPSLTSALARIRQLEADLEDARSWARHGYEIGQRHCGWTDHGTAPAWLTDGWPPHFDTCEHAARAADYDTALTRVRSLPEHPEVMDVTEPEPNGYLKGYKIGIRDAKRATLPGTKETSA